MGSGGKQQALVGHIYELLPLVSVAVKPPLELQERKVQRAQEVTVGEVGEGLPEVGGGFFGLERFAFVWLWHHYLNLCLFGGCTRATLIISDIRHEVGVSAALERKEAQDNRRGQVDGAQPVSLHTLSVCRGSGPTSCSYSPKCLEGVFSEVCTQHPSRPSPPGSARGRARRAGVLERWGLGSCLHRPDRGASAAHRVRPCVVPRTLPLVRASPLGVPPKVVAR